MNYVAIILAAVAGMAVSMAWYHPSMFGKAWLKATGISPAKAKAAHKKGIGKKMFTALVGNVVMVYVLWMFMGLLGASTFATATTVAFWTWLCFMAPLSLGPVLWEQKHINLFYINAGHNLASLVVMALVLVALP